MFQRPRPVSQHARSESLILLGSQSYLARSLAAWFQRGGRPAPDLVVGISRSTLEFAPLYEWLSRDSSLPPPRQILELFHGAVIVHFASALKPNTPVETAKAVAQAEMRFNLRLARLCSLAGVRALLLISSGGAVYGNEAAVLNEDHALCPLSVYGRSKVDAESIFASSAASGGWIAQALRLSNPYGPLQFGVLTHGLIPALIRSAYSKEPFLLHGDGLATKDYLFVDDFCAALASAVQAPASGPFNLSLGQSHSVLALIAHVEEATGSRLDLHRVDAFPGDVHDIHISSERFAKHYQWKPVFPIEQGIQFMCEHYTGSFSRAGVGTS